MTSRQTRKVAAEVRRIREAREHVVRALAAKPNIRGTMIGLRVRDGIVADDEVCLTALVDRKVEPQALAGKHRIPRSVAHKSGDVHLDVLQVKGLRPQSAPFSDGAIGIRVGPQIGTISAFCRAPSAVYALTCHHVIASAEQPMSVPIEAWSDAQHEWIRIGRTAASIPNSMPGQPGDFGFSDAALILVEHPALLAEAGAAQPIQAAQAVLGEPLQGDGAVRKMRNGQVIGVETIFDGFPADLFVQVSSPGTYAGDSGMLWKDSAGRAVAIHGFAEPAGPGEGSTITASMWATRAVAKLQAILNQPIQILSEPH